MDFDLMRKKNFQLYIIGSIAGLPACLAFFIIHSIFIFNMFSLSLEFFVLSALISIGTGISIVWAFLANMKDYEINSFIRFLVYLAIPQLGFETFLTLMVGIAIIIQWFPPLSSLPSDVGLLLENTGFLIRFTIFAILILIGLLLAYIGSGFVIGRRFGKNKKAIISVISANIMILYVSGRGLFFSTGSVLIGLGGGSVPPGMGVNEFILLVHLLVFSLQIAPAITFGLVFIMLEKILDSKFSHYEYENTTKT